MSVFDQVFTTVVGEEGGFTHDSADPGNWTGGKVGAGMLRGTKYGISAAAYPTKDIVNLTLEQAKAIYATDYWLPIRGASLSPPLALMVFDAAVNNGVGRAVRWLQHAIGTTEDGAFGHGTLAALSTTRLSVPELCIRFLTQRLLFMASLPTWPLEPGWAERICALPYKSMEMHA